MAQLDAGAAARGSVNQNECANLLPTFVPIQFGAEKNARSKWKQFCIAKQLYSFHWIISTHINKIYKGKV